MFDAVFSLFFIIYFQELRTLTRAYMVEIIHT